MTDLDFIAQRLAETRTELVRLVDRHDSLVWLHAALSAYEERTGHAAAVESLVAEAANDTEATTRLETHLRRASGAVE